MHPSPGSPVTPSPVTAVRRLSQEINTDTRHGELHHFVLSTQPCNHLPTPGRELFPTTLPSQHLFRWPHPQPWQPGVPSPALRLPHFQNIV